MNENKPLPKGWEVKRLNKVCDLKNGFAFKSKNYIEFSNTMNFRMSQIRPGGDIDLDKNPKFLPDNYSEKYKDYLLKEGDVVIAMTDLATEAKILGVPTIMPKDDKVWLQNQRVGRFCKIDYSIINLEFLKYILSSNEVHEYYKNLGKGGLQINIRKQDILNVEIPIPPLSEQKRIVVILDKTFAEITKAEAIAKTNLQNAKELFESYLNNVFENKGDDWEEKTLGEVIEIRSGRNQKEVLNPNGKYPILGSAGKVMGYADKFLCVSGTTIIGRKGTINKPLFIKTNFWNVDTAFGLIASDKLTNEFLYYFCRSFNFKELDKGTTLPSLVKKDLIKITISFPKLKNEQKQIVQKLEQLQSQVKKLEIIYQQKIIDLSELKKSILQKAFNGEL